MKTQNSVTVNPFDGLNFMIEELESQKIGNILNEELPALSKQNQYNWCVLICGYLRPHSSLDDLTPIEMINLLKEKSENLNLE